MCRRLHSMFFSTASIGNDDGIRITEDAVYRCSGSEAGERVEVVETGEVGHSAIVTDFAGQEKTKNPTNRREF